MSHLKYVEIQQIGCRSVDHYDNLYVGENWKPEDYEYEKTYKVASFGELFKLGIKFKKIDNSFNFFQKFMALCDSHGFIKG